VRNRTADYVQYLCTFCTEPSWEATQFHRFTILHPREYILTDRPSVGIRQCVFYSRIDVEGGSVEPTQILYLVVPRPEIVLAPIFSIVPEFVC
jgi:hypothetical protein